MCAAARPYCARQTHPHPVGGAMFMLEDMETAGRDDEVRPDEDSAPRTVNLEVELTITANLRWSRTARWQPDQGCVVRLLDPAILDAILGYRIENAEVAIDPDSRPLTL